MTEPKRIAYDHTLKSDKHFFGGYFNLAWNNITLIFESFAEEFDIKTTNKFSDSLKNFFPLGEQEITQLDFEYRADYLNRYFPIVGLIKYSTFDKDKSSYQIDQFVDDLSLILRAVEGLRNFYTHYYHAPFDLRDGDKSRLTDLYTLIDYLLLEVVQLVNKNKKGDDKTRELLKESLRKELDILREQKSKWMRENRYAADEEHVNNAVFNDAFNHLRYKPKNKRDFKVSRYYQAQLQDATGVENGICLSQSAVVFLLCAFLSKKEGEDFRARIKGFKAKVVDVESEEVNRKYNSLRFMATHWVYSWPAFKGYKKKLNTDYLKETLLVQIMDELSKVPDSLYEVLHEDKKKEFLEDVNEFIQEYDETKSLSESTVIHPVIRKRYENKFNYFVIRYLDEFVQFPSLKFQVHLGNYIHNSKTKSVPGMRGETRRLIKEKINVFGKLSELSKLKAENLGPQDSSSIGWELFPNPSYNFVGNNIPIYINWKSDTRNYKRLIKKIRDKRNKTEGRAQRANGKSKVFEIMNEVGISRSIASTEEPIAILSLNEIPSLLYELLIKQKTPQELEARLISKLEEKIIKLERFLYSKENKKKRVKCIPKTLQQAKEIVTVDREKLTRALEDEIATTQKRHKELKATKNTQGEYRLKKKAKGEMASWLAKDLIRLMPHPYRAQWKGYQHRQLQAALAFYHKRERRDALDLLCSVWDFTKDKDFHYKSELNSAFNSAYSFESLVFKYFDLRKKMLEAMHITATTDQTKLFNKGAKQQRLWTFFNKRRYTIDEFDKLKAKILAKPLVFDRGIFDDKPTYERDVKYEGSPEIFADWYRYAQEYKNYQAFYDKELYPRDYSKLYELEEAKGKELTDKTKLFTRLTRDRRIKQNQIQDLFLKLIAEDLGQKVFGLSTSDSAITLSEVFTSQAERINQRAAARSQSKRKKGDYSENKIKESYIWSKTFPYEYGQIKEPAVKLKDFGKFRQLLEDERVESIFSYNKNRIWSKKEIEEEIQSYETIRREEIFKEIQNFEAYLWQRKDASKPDEIPNFKKDVVNEVLKKLKGKGEQPIEDSDINWLENTKLEENKVNNLSLQKPLVQKAFFTILIRNKFAHNQLINLFFWKQIQTCYRQYEQTADESISAYLLEALKAFIDEMKKELKKKE